MSTPFKSEWLQPGAVVPVDVETTAALVAEIHRLIGVVRGMALAQLEQEPVAVVTGVYGGRFTYAPFKSTVVLPVGAALYLQPSQRTWVGLTNKERAECWETIPELAMANKVEAKLREKNSAA